MILKNFKKLQEFLKESKNIVIIGHKNPDGDAVGSALALANYLSKKGHLAQVMMPNKFPDFLSWMPNSKSVYFFEYQKEECTEKIEKSDIIFLLDFNTLHRVGDEMQQVLEKYTKDFALIDHHQQPDEFKYMYSDVEICSTCQMVYHFIEKMGDVNLIDKTIATCLYTGIMTDTGSFRFRTTTGTTHRIVADLIEKGVENDKIHSNTFDANSYGRLQLLGKALSNLKVLPEYKTAYITISQAEKEQYEYQRGDTDGVVNYALSLKDTVFGVIFIEDLEQGIIKISFRSKGTFSVNEFAGKYFQGGGHNNAAGGKSVETIEKTVEKFVSLLPKYKNELQQSYK